MIRRFVSSTLALLVLGANIGFSNTASANPSNEYLNELRGCIHTATTGLERSQCYWAHDDRRVRLGK